LDAFEHAIDPLSLEAEEAENAFHAAVTEIYNSQIRSRHPSITLGQFTSAVRTHCFRYLNRN